MANAYARSMATRIAIADDDEDTRALVRRALESPGIEIREAASGGELVELLAADGCDLLVTDITMPWMSGLQVLVSARTAGFATPALVITGLPDPALPARVVALGHASLLRKPFGIDELRAAVSALLGPDAGRAG
jgi:DNA-binding response OmpR family regulator